MGRATCVLRHGERRAHSGVFLQDVWRGKHTKQYTLLQSLRASVLIVSGSFEQLLVYSGTVLTVFSALAVGAVLVLRRKEPDLPRPYRTPLYPLVPGFFILMSMVIVLNAASERPFEAGLGLATVLAGTPLYFLWQRFRATQQAADSSRQQG